MRFGVVVPSYGPLARVDDVARLIFAAERLGYESAWFADHVAVPEYATDWLTPPVLEPLALCAYGAGITTRLGFGVDVLVAPYRNPVVLAATAATIDRLARGRLVLGVGIGYLEGEFAAVGVPYRERATRAEAVLRILRETWSSGSTPRGDHVVTPTPGGAPLWVGGNVDAALDRAARLGDGWHPLLPSPASYANGRRRIEARRAQAGIDHPFTFSYSGPLGRVLDHARHDWTAMTDPRLTRPEYGYVQPVPRANGGRPRFTGTPEQLVEDIEVLAAHGVEHLVLRFWTSASGLDAAGVEEQFEAFATEVMSRYPSKGAQARGSGVA